MKTSTHAPTEASSDAGETPTRSRPGLAIPALIVVTTLVIAFGVSLLLHSDTSGDSRSGHKAANDVGNVTGAPIGAPPKVPVYAGGTIDGTPIDLPDGAEVTGVAHHGDGWILGYTIDGTDRLAFIDDTGTTTTSHRVPTRGASPARTLAASLDGSTAFVNADGRLELDGPEGTPVQTWTLGGGRGSSPLAILGDGSVVLLGGYAFEIAEPSADVVTPWIAFGPAAPGEPNAEIVAVVGDCLVTADASNGRPFFIRCEDPWLGVDPSGTVIASRLRTGNDTYRVLLQDATGGQVIADVDLRGIADFTPQGVWEDDSHLLITVRTRSDGWQILRVGTDGTVTRTETVDLGAGRTPGFVIGPWRIDLV